MILTLLLIIAAVVAISRTVTHRRHKRDLFEAISYNANDDVAQVGISILVSGVRDLSQIESLLASDYAHYEVIIVGDWADKRSQLRRVISNFSLIEVNYTALKELPSHPIRALYRSRKRLFRRLVVVDRASTIPEDDLDVGAGVSIYENLLALRTSTALKSDSLSTLILKLSTHASGSIDAIQSAIGEQLSLIRREMVVANGGFASSQSLKIKPRRRLLLWQPLLRKE